MLHLETIADLRAACDRARAEARRVGLVPTMGFLHEGHRSLMRAAREACGFIVVTLRVNSLIATLSTMIAYRGMALALTDALLVQLPAPIRFIGNTKFGGIPVDLPIMLAVLILVHLLQTRTSFGRQIMAMGNDLTVARKVGLPVDRTGFLRHAGVEMEQRDPQIAEAQ